jgi:ketosteroid isomerase-like protein
LARTRNKLNRPASPAQDAGHSPSARGSSIRPFLRTKKRIVAGILLSAALIALVLLAPARGGPVAEKEIRQFAESYFRDWSAGDIAAYRAHFDESAQIAFVRDGQVVECQALEPFIRQQDQMLREAKGTMSERMTSFRVQFDAVTAHVTAHWELTHGREKTVGVDRFTLLRNPRGQWKILYLVFYHGRG